MPIWYCVHWGSCSFGIVFNWVCVHSGSCSFGIVSIWDDVYSEMCSFGMVFIRYRVQLRWCPFVIVSIHGFLHSGLSRLGIVHNRDVSIQNHVQDPVQTNKLNMFFSKLRCFLRQSLRYF